MVHSASDVSALRAMWVELHERALSHTPGKNDSKWITQWSSRLPRFTTGCRCKEHWSKYYNNHPINFTQLGAYFQWTVDAHNAVNTRLGKKSLTVEEAGKLYHKSSRGGSSAAAEPPKLIPETSTVEKVALTTKKSTPVTSPKKHHRWVKTSLKPVSHPRTRCPRYR